MKRSAVFIVASLLAGCAQRRVPLDIPRREANAMTGTAFIASLARLSREEREGAIRRELLAGNMPSFMRKLRTVEASLVGSDSIKHTIAYEVMPDYLAIGSDDDFVRMPMIPYTAQDFCDAFGFVLPTRKMVNDIWSHVDWYVDYSHGVRPVRRWMRVDGKPVTFEKILSDVLLRDLLSDEGEVSVSRYDK